MLQGRQLRGAASQLDKLDAPESASATRRKSSGALDGADAGGAAAATATCWRLRSRRRAPRPRVGEISLALEKVFGRHQAEIKAIAGVYAARPAPWPTRSSACKSWSPPSPSADGRRPRILVAKIGQDGHDRGQKVIASAFADLGFDVDVGPLFATPGGGRAPGGGERRARASACRSLAAGHLTLVPELKAELEKLGRGDIMIVVGGVIPPQDYEALKAAGAAAIFPPGTVIAAAAEDLLKPQSPARPRSRSRGVRCSSSPHFMKVILTDVPTSHLPSPAALAPGIRAGDRASLARAITLIESRRADHQQAARALVQELLPHTGAAVRVGITGAPGVGKSTTIDALGTMLTAQGHKVAVLAVDPSSTRTGGSILGDKTRMPRLAIDPNAYIRPSPASGTLGGVAAKTREAMLVCEAAGYDVVLVETVGVGQSETAVADMTDFFLVLMLPGAGDELQGLKKGHRRARRLDRGQQGRRRQYQARDLGRRRIPRRTAYSQAPLAALDAKPSSPIRR